MHVSCLDLVWVPLTYLVPVSCSYLHAHNIIRGITGYGAGNGPYIAIHDGFQPLTVWVNVLPDADRIILDTHPYFAFDGQPNNQPIDANDGIGEPGGVWPLQACNAWGPSFNNRFGFSARLGRTRY